MSQIRILHLSDLHYSPLHRKDQSHVITALIEDISSHHQELPIDVILFTGDLVLAGKNADDFSEAFDTAIKPIINLTSVTIPRFATVPGNHDIDRDCIKSKMHLRLLEKDFLQEVGDATSLNKFIDDCLADPAAYSACFEKLENYFRFEQSLFGEWWARDNPFFGVQRIEIRGTRLGVAGFNTAWRSQGEGDALDKGKLLLGERAVDAAAEALADCDVRLALYHHPLDYLVDYDNRKVKPRLQEAFHIHCYGHRHEVGAATEASTVGASVLLQSGCIYQHREYLNGYQILDIDLSGSEVRLHSRRYFDQPRRRFGPDGSLGETGSVALTLKLTAGSADDQWRVLLPKIEAYVREKGNEHLALMSALGEELFDLEHHVIEQPLTTLPYPETIAQTSGDLDNDVEPFPDEQSDIKEALRSKKDFYIIGSPQSGKTILAYIALWHCSRGVTDVARLPLYVPFSNLRHRANLERHLLNAFYRDFEHIETLRNIAPLERLYVVDDVDADDIERCKILATLKAQSPRARFILFRGSKSFLFLGNRFFRHFGVHPTTLRIEDLPRRAIRELTRKLSLPTNFGDPEIANTAYHEVIKRIQSGGFPRTAYIVVLLLFAIRLQREYKHINEAVLLDNVVDAFMGKADLASVRRGEFGFRGRSLVAQHLAVQLKNRSSVPYNDALNMIATFLKERALPFKADQILMEFINGGLVGEYEDQVLFRYSRLQDFLIAKELAENRSMLEAVLTGSCLKEYSRELDLYTALSGRAIEVAHAIERSLQEFQVGLDDAATELTALADDPPGMFLTKTELKEV